MQRSVSLLRATLDSTADGILVVNLERRIVSFNRRFVSMWGVPGEILASGEDARAMAHAMSQVRDPEAFRARMQELYADEEATGEDLLRLKDGRVFERFSGPQRMNGQVVGRVWSFRDVTAYWRSVEALRASEERYRDIFERTREAIYVTRRDGGFVDVNDAMLELFGYTREEMLALNAADLYADPADRSRFQREIGVDGHVQDYSMRLRARDGRILDCQLTSSMSQDEDGAPEAYHGILHDVTERKRAEAALRASEEYFRTLIENALDTITILDPDGTIVYESPAVERVLGYPPADRVGRPIFDFVHPADRHVVRQAFDTALGSTLTKVELRFLHRDGTWRVLEAVGRNLIGDPAVRGVVINARDVTKRKEAEDQLLHDALHDRLTQLPNRALFMDRLTQLLRRSDRPGSPGYAVLFLDLDRFKVVNDSLGHRAGDELLISIARRLETCLRPGDTVARLGGDEFTILVDGTADLAQVTHMAERIHEVLRTPFVVEGHEVFASASIGIALGCHSYTQPEEVLRNADLAMYRAKAEGPGHHEVFDGHMHAQALERLDLESALRRAVERNELRVYYQALVDLRTGALTGLEALLRWEHPTRGLLHPSTFVDLAEETGLIVPIGWWVIETVCEQMRAWRAEMPGALDISVNVNFSGLQLSQHRLVERLEDILRRTDTPEGGLRIELTESVLMRNADLTIATLRRLHDIGVQTAIDDFGTGYSSLSYLHHFPTDSVKIERSFIGRIGPDGQNAEIVRTIMTLAHDLGMRVVAEGVETAAQHHHLRELGCEFGQGFLFHRPAPASDIRDLIRGVGTGVASVP